jgi:hypothetical protein
MLYGMQGMSDVQVRSVLDMLPALLGSCREPLEYSERGQYAVRYAGHEQ